MITYLWRTVAVVTFRRDVIRYREDLVSSHGGRDDEARSDGRQRRQYGVVFVVNCETNVYTVLIITIKLLMSLCNISLR
jgi:hypothetical protein